MKTIAHISDLHFGVEDTPVAEELYRDLCALSPALVVVSGDLTQRARRHQFSKARHYLERLPFPTLVVPGNHDVPLYDVARRFLSPLTRYRTFISPELNPFYRTPEMAVLGLNTARSLTWKNGRISLEQMSLIRRKFTSLPGSLFRVVVTHHPFIPPPDEPQRAVQLVGRANRAVQALDECKVDLLLSGHLHHGYTGDVRTFYPAARRSIIVVQAGTAISRRLRQEPNAYNLIAFEDRTLLISVRVWQEGTFVTSTQVTHRLEGEEWRTANTRLAGRRREPRPALRR